MTVVINGVKGPYNLSTPGGYGANTAYNVHQASPKTILSADIHISPNREKLSENALGHAKARIGFFDVNHDGKLNIDEFTQVCKGDEESASWFMAVYDVNDDGLIDVEEDAASVVFTLDPVLLLGRTFFNYVGPGESEGLSLEQQREFQEAKENGLTDPRAFGPSLRPYSTPYSRTLAEGFAVNFPNFTCETLEKIVSDLKLDQMA